MARTMSTDANLLQWFRAVAVVLAGACCTLTGGCVGFLAQVGYWTGAANVPAAFSGLEGKRVAVVCITDSSTFGPQADSLVLADMIASALRQNVKDIELVPSDEIADWIDRNDWDEMDFEEIGRGVQAERVVAVELAGLSLYEGPTLYKGRASAKVRVLDMEQGGKELFRRQLHEITFPVNGAYPATSTSEATFRRSFIDVLARQISRLFYEYEMTERFGADPAFLG